MPIHVKYFASLRERVGRSEESIDASTVSTVLDVWNRAARGQMAPGNLLAAVNHEHAELDHPVKDGDEVAFFPPVTGG
ncbi:MAG: molybdopterin converting factor subunit 1 [Proteobacteria bacterium]|nr:MAG: molybdopterin converting factor subunit 1 [Pseudomonadota bacterium]QKK12406.1 MAG: molybdopterin converting factor subunit 1 [Pseudomonadota bacterium]